MSAILGSTLALVITAASILALTLEWLHVRWGLLPYFVTAAAIGACGYVTRRNLQPNAVFAGLGCLLGGGATAIFAVRYPGAPLAARVGTALLAFVAAAGLVRTIRLAR